MRLAQTEKAIWIDNAIRALCVTALVVCALSFFSALAIGGSEREQAESSWITQQVRDGATLDEATRASQEQEFGASAPQWLLVVCVSALGVGLLSGAARFYTIGLRPW